METTPQTMFLKKSENLQVYVLTRFLGFAFVVLYIMSMAVLEQIFIGITTGEWWGTVEEDEWLDYLGLFIWLNRNRGKIFILNWTYWSFC